MLRALGFLFLLLLVATATLFGARYYLDRQARAFVTQAVRPIYANWDFDALKLRASPRVLKIEDFESSGRELFRMFSGALGPLLSAAAPDGEPQFSWKSDAEIRGLYANYRVQAKFEHGPAQLQFVLVKESGVWRIVGFHIDAPAAMAAVAEAIRQAGSEPSFKTGGSEETATVTAAATQVMACLDSDAVGRCWDNASAAFRQSVTKSKFVTEIGAARADSGLPQNRKLRAVEFALDIPGHPRGQYARAVFDTTFSRATLEEGLLFHKQEGEWVFSGYRWGERR